MKLLQINATANIGATGRIAEQIGIVAIEHNWKSYIAYGRDAGESASNLLKIGNKVDQLNHLLKTRLLDRHGFGSTKATKKLTKEIEEINPDVIHLNNLHGYYLNVEILFNFLKIINKPVFWSLYDCWAFTGHCAYFDLVGCEKWKNECNRCPLTSDYPTSWLKDNSKENFNEKKNIFIGLENLTIITNSQWLGDQVSQSYLKDYPIEIIKNGIDTEAFKPVDTESEKHELSIDGKFIILGVANQWLERKGFSDFIKLSKFLKDDEVILLDNINEEQRKELPPNILGLNKAKGVKELAILYSMANVFVNPTYADNFPTTNLEALACGTPVITYNTGGSPESINEDTGYVVEKGNIANLAQAISLIRSNPEKFKSQTCRTRAEQNFNYKIQFPKYLSLFE